MFFLAQVAAQPQTLPSPGLGGGELARGLFAVFLVFGLLGLLAWLARRGSLAGLAGFTRSGKGPIQIETTVPLGDRRSLAIVAVDGRRLLLGMTPMQISLVTELRAAEPFDQALARATSSGSSPVTHS